MFTMRYDNQFRSMKNKPLFHAMFNLSGGLKTAVLVVLIACGFGASAQRSRAMYSYGGSGGGTTNYGIIIGGDYDKPLSDLGEFYKPAPAFDIGVLKYVGDFTFSLNLGYHQYQPIQATSFYADSISSVSSSISNYSTISYYFGAIYNIALSDNVKFFFGANFGIYYNHYSSSDSADGEVTDSSDTHDEDLYIAPRGGLSFKLSDALDLNLQAKYNLFSPTGNTYDNPDVGHFYKSFATGISFSYRF